jgi:hypothetical protein
VLEKVGQDRKFGPELVEEQLWRGRVDPEHQDATAIGHG